MRFKRRCLKMPHNVPSKTKSTLKNGTSSGGKRGARNQTKPRSPGNREMCAKNEATHKRLDGRLSGAQGERL